MKLARRQFLRLAAGAAMLPASVSAQAYPTRPVKIIVGQAAGSASDIIARLIAQFLSEFFHIARVDRLEHLIRFLEHERTERCMCLFTVPGTAARRPKCSDDGDELFEFFAQRFAGSRTLGVRSGHGLVC